MHSSSNRDGVHQVLDTITEGFDEENWTSSDLGSVKLPTEQEVSVQLQEEAELRTRVRRETTESLISNLHSLKPVPFMDSRLIEVGILNEDLSKSKMRISIRNLLVEVNRAGKDSEAHYHLLHPDAAALSFASSLASPATRLRRSGSHRSRSNSITGETLHDRDVIPELKIRDLRQLESHFNHHEEPFILIRRHCVLVSLGPHVRVIVQSKRLLILVHQEDDEEQREEGGGTGAGGGHSQTLLHLLADTVQNLMKSSRFGVIELTDSPQLLPPFEVKAYCALLSMHHSLLSREYNTLLCRSKSLIASISDHTMLSVRLQEFMHLNHDNVVDLQGRVSGTWRMISSLLEGADEDLLLFMNLKVLDHNPTLYGISPEEAASELYAGFSDIESIIESYLVDFRAIENQVEVLVRKLNHVEQSINLKLDTSRNELLFATTILSVFATVISFSGYITGVFGMNLDNTKTIQTTPGVFYAVFCTTFFLIGVGAAIIITVFRFYHILPTHARMHTGVESGDYTRRRKKKEQQQQQQPGDRKNSLEIGNTRNMMHFTSSKNS